MVYCYTCVNNLSCYGFVFPVSIKQLNIDSFPQRVLITRIFRAAKKVLHCVHPGISLLSFVTEQRWLRSSECIAPLLTTSCMYGTWPTVNFLCLKYNTILCDWILDFMIAYKKRWTRVLVSCLVKNACGVVCLFSNRVPKPSLSTNNQLEICFTFSEFCFTFFYTLR